MDIMVGVDEVDPAQVEHEACEEYHGESAGLEQRTCKVSGVILAIVGHRERLSTYTWSKYGQTAKSTKSCNKRHIVSIKINCRLLRVFLTEPI